MTDNLTDIASQPLPVEDIMMKLISFGQKHPDLAKDETAQMFSLDQKYGFETASRIREMKKKYKKDWSEAENLFLNGGVVEDSPQCESQGNGPEQQKTYLDRYIGPDGLLAQKGWDKETLEQTSKQTTALVDRIETVSRQLGENELCTALVVGHVQSGKTANFCADINSWMDIVSSSGEKGAKYNTFIILTSNNTALGTQTEERLRKDIIPISDFLEAFKEGGNEVADVVKKYGGLLSFRKDAELRKNETTGSSVRAQPTFGVPIDKPKCIVAVAIKNPSTINDLSAYLKRNDALRKGGVVIIDDEADVITPTRDKKGEAAKTRQAILDMVETIRKDGRPIAYVAFTATPYASVLNQFPSQEGNPLYPHIVQVLKPSEEYFGSARILGGLREKATGQLQIIPETKDTIDGILDKGELPDSLKEAFAWFLCTVCARRHRKAEEPISMLIHIARDVDTHENICKNLKDFVTKGQQELLALCRELWESKVKKTYTKKDIPLDYPNRDGVEEYEISWEDMEQTLAELLDERRTDKPNDFSRGLNFRIVNAKEKTTKEDFHYPTDDEIENGAPRDVAIVAIGGDRIARGLTLEGLTTSYFARKANYGDSLLQYARWQGYRRGYEVLPRVWMTKDDLAFFKEATWMERETRRKLEEEFYDNVDHWAHPVTVAVRPKTKLKPTAKMRDAEIARGPTISSVDTSYIGNDPSAWKEVFDETEQFIEKLGEPPLAEEGDPVIWRKVSGAMVLDYLRRVKVKYPDSAGFASWQDNYEMEIATKDWIVCFIPLKGKPNETSSVCATGVFFNGKQMRTVKAKNLFPLYIKTVRANKYADDIVDVPACYWEQNQTDLDKDKVTEILHNSGLNETPLLRIYLHAAKDKDGNLYLPGKVEDSDIATHPIILLSIAAARLPGVDRDRVVYHVNPADFIGDPALIKERLERLIFELEMGDEDENNDEAENDDGTDHGEDKPCVRCKFVANDNPKNNTPKEAVILKGSRITASMADWLRNPGAPEKIRVETPSPIPQFDEGVVELQSDVKIVGCLAHDLAKGLLRESRTFTRNKDCKKWIVTDEDDPGNYLAGKDLLDLLESVKEDE